jgi:hypothetical protein
MRPIAALSFLVAALLSGCSMFDGGTDPYQVVPVSAVSAELVGFGGEAPDGDRAVEFRYAGLIFAPCFEFHGYDYEVEAESMSVEVNVDARSVEGFCQSQAADTLRVERMGLSVPEPGPYTFSFKRTGAPPIEVHVDVP